MLGYLQSVEPVYTALPMFPQQPPALIPKVMVATICCTRKGSSLMGCLANLAKLSYRRTELHVNFQAQNNIGGELDIQGLAANENVPFHVSSEVWQMHQTWCPAPQFDQDQARLHPICIARNMVMQTASWAVQPDYLLLVDSDVRIPSDSIERMLKVFEMSADILNMGTHFGGPGVSQIAEINREAGGQVASCLYFVGGLVPGRQDHKHLNYLSEDYSALYCRDHSLRVCNHSTLGFLMIRKPAFQYLRFRYGYAIEKPDVMLSEDPAIAEQGRQGGWGRWVIDMELKAEHVDDPNTIKQGLGKTQF